MSSADSVKQRSGSCKSSTLIAENTNVASSARGHWPPPAVKEAKGTPAVGIRKEQPYLKEAQQAEQAPGVQQALKKKFGCIVGWCAKQSLALLAGCKSRSGGRSGRLFARANHPPVSSVAPLADSVANGMETVANVNNRGEAYTENLVGQRGGRTTLKRFQPRQ